MGTQLRTHPCCALSQQRLCCSLRMLCPREPSWGRRSVGLSQTLHPKPPGCGILTLPKAFSHQMKIWKDFPTVLGMDKHFHIDEPRPAPSFITERVKNNSWI